MVMVDLIDADKPDNGPQDAICRVMALTRDKALKRLDQAVLDKDYEPGNIPEPMLTINDREALESLNVADYQNAQYEDGLK